MPVKKSKVITTAKPHTIKKFELIEMYIKAWAQKLMLNNACNGLIFIDCMCNSGVYKDINGNIVDEEYRHAVQLALNEIRSMEIDLVILQSRSPTCAVKNIYDGSFTGKLIKGQGLFAQALIEAGYKVLDSEDF